MSVRYGGKLAKANIETSVGSRGGCYDSALAKKINSVYKPEVILRRTPWKTRRSFELATLAWVVWLKHHWLLDSIGYIPAGRKPTQTTIVSGHPSPT